MAEASVHSNTNKTCLLCDAGGDILVRLDCEHSYCLICLSYIAIKCRANGSNESQLVCPAKGCNKTCKMDEQLAGLIKTTIQQTLVPRLNSIEEITETSSRRLDDSPEQPSLHLGDSRNQPRRPSVKQNPQSFEHSMEHITPSTRHLLSKADSPIEKTSYQEYCHEHPLEESTFVCLSCLNALLCVKCMMQQTHNGHNVKTLEKSIEYLTEQMGLRKLEVNEKIDLLEMKQRRLQDKKELLAEKCTKAKMHIMDSVSMIVAKAKKKEAELLQACQGHFQALEGALADDLENIKRRLFNLRKFKYDFRKLHHSEQYPPIDFFSFFNKIKTELDQNLSQTPLKFTSPQTLQSGVSLHERDLLEIIESISRLQVFIGPSEPSGIVMSSNLGIGIGSSLNSVNNITITNFTSKNNSAEKKMKHLKTEESNYNIHLKTEHVKSAGKLGVRCGSPNQGGLPSYITKFLDKHNGRAVGSNNDSESKYSKFTNSKFSFNALEIQTGEESGKKRGTIPKKRVERKTTNPLESLKNQKLIFQTKKTKLNK